MINAPLIILLIINMFSSIGYSLIAPLYPFLAKSKGVDDFLIGIIFASYAISFVSASFFVSFLVNKVGKSNLFKLAIFVEASCTIIFGLLENINDYNIFVILSMMVRLLQGIGSALSSTLVYSITASLCDDSNLNMMIGYMELSFSIGVSIGPFLASILYYLKGYAFTFIVCGCMNYLCFPFISYIKISEDKYESPGYLKIIFNFEVFSILLAIIFDMASLSFIYPVFSNHLLMKYGIGVETSSLFYVINIFSYFIMVQFLNKLKTFSMKLLITLGLIVNSFSVLLLAPVSIFPQSIFIIILGLCLLGASGGTVTVPALIDLLNTLKNELNLDENAANDISCAIFNLALNIGEAVGPILGGALTHYYSFDLSCYDMCLLNFIYLFIFIFLNFSKLKFTPPKETKKDPELDYDYKQITAIRKKSENMEHHAVVRYRAFSLASLSSKLSLE